MENFGTYNGAHGAEAFGFRKLAKVYWNLQAPRLYEEALARNEAMLGQRRRARRGNRRAYRPLAQGQVRRPRCADAGQRVVGQ